MGVFFRLLVLVCVFALHSLLADSQAAGEERVLTYRHFRVTDADGRVARVEPIAADPLPLWARDVSRELHEWSGGPKPDRSYFEGPIPFVIPPPEGSGEPFNAHNHQPDLTWLPNGDLFAVWYSTTRESGTELTVLASRLRAGNARWDPAYEFFKSENRNMHGNSVFYDGQGTLHHLNGMAPDGATGWGRLALLHRYSLDNGVTWSTARPVSTGADYQRRHQVIAGVKRTRDGALIQPCDATPGGQGPTAIHISRDGGRTWSDPGGDIRGIHAGVVELKDGRLMAMGRGQAIDGCMPKSVSDDMGQTWTYSASPFPPIGGGQRLVLMRLQEGPVMLVSFTSGNRDKPEAGHMTFIDQRGNEFIGHGMFAALSFDEGRTWPVRKLLTPGEGTYDGGAWTGEFTATPERAEHAGYLAATQTPDGVVHLISSRLHYRFNLAWLKQPNEGPTAVRHGKVLYREDRFGGWPANGGMWARGQEILVCYTEADHQDRSGHTYGSATAQSMLARSLDGGDTWSREDALAQGVTAEAHDHRVAERAKPVCTLAEPVDFSPLDFVMLFHRPSDGRGVTRLFCAETRGRILTSGIPVSCGDRTASW